MHRKRERELLNPSADITEEVWGELSLSYEQGVKNMRELTPNQKQQYHS